jgi:hypothetical protein
MGLGVKEKLLTFHSCITAGSIFFPDGLNCDQNHNMRALMRGILTT